MADAWRPPICQRAAGQRIKVQTRNSGGDVQIVKAGTGFTDIPGQRRQQPTGAHDIAAGGLALQTLSDPQQGRAGSVQMGGAFDQVCRNAGCPLSPGGGTGRQQGQHFVVTHGVFGYEVSLKKSVPVQNVQQAEGQGRVRAGKRLEVEVGLGRGLRPDWVDNDLVGGGFG